MNYGCAGGGFSPDFSTSCWVVVVVVPPGVVTVVSFLTAALSVQPRLANNSEPTHNVLNRRRFMVAFPEVLVR